jgi:hypothetical protein
MERQPKILVNLAILMHGKVINLDINRNIFDNVRFVSKAGTFQDTATTVMRERQILPKLYYLFRKNLNDTTNNKIVNYITEERPEYQKFIRDELTLNPEKVYRLFENINIDKSLSKSLIRPPGLINEILCYIEYLVEFQGIFLISVHEDDTLIYPTSDELTQNIDLLDLNNLREFATLFGKELPNLVNDSTEFPNYLPFHQEELNVLNNNNLTKEEKESKIEEIQNNFYELLNQWKLTIKHNEIDSIRMSELVKIIKNIVGENCFINLLDYSCNSISKYVPKSQRLNMQYFESLDIESGRLYTNLGGKTNKKSKKNRKNNRRNKSNKQK